MARNQRRRILVSPAFQVRLVGSFLLAFLGAGAVFCGVLLFVFQEFEALGRLLELPPGHFFYWMLADLKWWAGTMVAATFVGVFAAMAYGGLIHGRRIAGPVLSVCRRVEELASGEIDTPLRSRRDDYFSELTESLNRHLDAEQEPKAAGSAR